MKKKVLATFLVVALVAAMPMSAMAKISSGTGITSGSSDNDSYTSTTPTNPSGTTTTTEDGKSLTTNGAGSNTESVSAVFAVGNAETAGLPEAVVSSINSINSGVALATAVGNPDLAGYSALTRTAAVILQDTTTKGVANKEATVTLYIPNLIEGLQNVKILYYENATGLWRVVDPTAIDFNKKTVTFTMFGSGTVTVIHQ